MHIVFIPGMQCTGEVYLELIALLRPQFPAMRMTVHEVAESGLGDAALAVAGKLGEPGIVVGHSLGGTVAMATARMFPNSVAGMVLVCANPRPPRVDQVSTWENMKQQVQAGQLGEISGGIVPKLLAGQAWSNPHAAATAEKTCLRMTEEVGGAGLFAQLGVQAQRVDERQALGNFPGPVLAVAAAQDSLVPAAVVQEIATNAQKGSFVTVDGASHMLPMTEPAHLSSILAQWLGTNFDPMPAAAGHVID